MCNGLHNVKRNPKAGPHMGRKKDPCIFAVGTSDNDPARTGTIHVRVSPMIGLAIIEVTTHGKMINLITAPNNSLTLSEVVNVKAALAIFSIPGSDISIPIHPP